MNELSFTKKMVEFLKKPYPSRCIFYREDPDYYKYRTKDECKNVCIKNKAFLTEQCANYFSVLTSMQMFEKEFKDQRICEHDKQVFLCLTNLITR